MSDPIRDLESFPTDGAAVDPLSPAEVRRRGERLRRRHHAAAAVAGVAAIALVVVPLGLVFGGDRDDEVRPSGPTTSSTTWRTEIPEGFPILAGIENDPEGAQPALGPEDPGLETVSLCAEEVWPPEAVDRLAGSDPALDHSWNRELLLFPSDAEARAALTRIRDRLAACDQEPTTDPAIPDREFQLAHTGHPGDAGADEAVTWTDAYTDGSIGTQVFQFVRVGNAVAGSEVSSEADRDGVADQVPMVTDSNAPLVETMCVFAADPCDARPASGWRTEIPEGFPLPLGMAEPDGESRRTTSEDTDQPWMYVPCPTEREFATNLPADADRVAAASVRLRTADPVTLRMLALYVDDAAARAAMDQIKEQAARCPDAPGIVEGVDEWRWTVEPDTSPGEETLVVEGGVVSIETDEPVLHRTVLHLTRVGNAVMSSAISDEGRLGDPLGGFMEAHPQVVDDMCVFAEHPCRVETEPGPAPTLDDTQLVPARDLPRLGGMPWRKVEPQAGPTLVCQGAPLTELGPWEIVTREFRVRAESADADLGMVNTAVLRFSDEELADRAYDTVLDWLAACPGSQAPVRPTVNDRVAPVTVDLGPGTAPVDRAHRVLVAWQPPDFCPEGCDMAYFEHDVVVQVGSHLVLVSEAEAAGPCAPGDACPETEDSLRPWKDRVDEVTRLTVGRGVGHLS